MYSVYCDVCQRVSQTEARPLYALAAPDRNGSRSAVNACSQECVDRYNNEHKQEIAAATAIYERRKTVEKIGQTLNSPEKLAFKSELDRIWRGEIETDATQLYAPSWTHYGSDWASTADTQAPAFAKASVDFLEGTSRSMIFTGLTGRGKTWAAYGMVHGFLLHNFDKLWHSARFLPWSQLKILTTKCSSNFGPTADAAEESMKWLQKVGLLVIDEFGLSKPNDNQLDHLHELLNERFVKGRWTLLTTSRGLPELEEFMGGGIVSRFSGQRTGGRAVDFDGPNRRK